MSFCKSHTTIIIRNHIVCVHVLLMRKNAKWFSMVMLSRFCKNCLISHCESSNNRIMSLPPVLGPLVAPTVARLQHFLAMQSRKCVHCAEPISNEMTEMIDHCRHCPNVTRTDKKKFVCFACSYATQYACYIKTHVMTHTGDKPFACSFCDYTCNQSSNLQTHLRIHKADKMYSCGKCSYQTPSLADLKLHLKNMHLYWALCILFVIK